MEPITVAEPEEAQKRPESARGSHPPHEPASVGAQDPDGSSSPATDPDADLFPSHSLLHDFVILLALTGFYFAAGRLGLSLAIVNSSTSAVWPATGIALASLLVLGMRAWPAIFVGAFLVNVTTTGSPLASVGIAVGNTLEALCGAALVHRYARGADVFERPGTILRFAVLAGLGSTTVAATIGAGSLVLSGLADWSSYGAVWVTWWLGDAGGCLVTAPVVLLWARAPRPRFRPAEIAELVLVALALFGVGGFVFVGWFGDMAGNRPLEFLCVPILVWTAFRFGLRETATGIVLLAGMAIWGTLSGHGPFTWNDQNRSLLLLQAFTAITSVTVLALASAVSERRLVEQALGEKLLELERSNEELERFAHVASHDLREPLRMVASYTELLHVRYKDRLDADAEEFIGYAVDGAHRMQRMIDDLLAFSRLGSSRREPALTDCEKVLAIVQANLGAAIQDCGAIVTHDPLPILKADARQLIPLFQNLLGNAVKFHGRARPLVHVSASRLEDAWEFHVRDNGIGIDRRHFDRIFVMFQRLHSVERYPGTGIGLAACKKIVERHGGRFRVASEPGVGSVFSFTIPDQH